MPGMAFDKTFHGQPSALEEAVLVHSLHGIVRTGWIEPAALPQKRADAELIKTDEFNQQKSQHLPRL